VTGAKLGSERMMTIGQEHVLLPGNVANPAFDYVALGHIHKRQVLNEHPPVVYSGSLERVDFGEENDEKGFYLVEIEQDGGERKVTYDFHPVEGRVFRTIEVNIEENDSDPTAAVLGAISPGGEDKVTDAIVRLQISLPSGFEGQLRDSEIRDALKGAYHSTISKEVKRESRIRLGQSSAEEIAPVDALKIYLEANYPPERAKVLQEYGEKLIRGEVSDE
jgi:exonuclease SbcD